MNINDFPAPETPATFAEQLRLIFARQSELMTKYQEIEGLPSPPLSLHLASAQRVLKDFAWRTTEELAEAYEALAKHSSDDETAKAHAHEELADALHFFVELLIFAGITPEQCLAITPNGPLVITGRSLPEAYWLMTYELGLAMNFLRNKPWKQSQVPTDEGRFRGQLLNAWAALMDLWSVHDLNCVDMFAYYFRKSDVNAFRQRSNY